MSFSANATKMYKWVDADGRISYQDSPPPKGAKVLKESTVESSSRGDSGSNSTPVRVYTVANCDTCQNVISHLRKNDVPHLEIPLQDDRDAQTLILERTSSLIAPTIFVGEDIFQGGNLVSLDNLLRAKDYLDEEPQPDQNRPRRVRLPSEEELIDSSELVEAVD